MRALGRVAVGISELISEADPRLCDAFERGTVP